MAPPRDRLFPPRQGDIRSAGEAGPSFRLEHRGTHRELLRRMAWAAPLWPGDVDAVVVPAGRNPSFLGFAAETAIECGWRLIVLCSREAEAATALPWLIEHHPGVDAITLDVDERTSPEWTRLPLAAHPESHRDGYPDVAAKRNLALVIARLAGWRRVLFMDDDVCGVQPDDLRRAAGLLHHRRAAPPTAAVAWSADHFPDNSVVCHANRWSGGWQETFVGAGLLVVQTAPPFTPAFFPPVYNEDWLFLHDALAQRAVVHGGGVGQRVYEPFLDPGRAADEEFGDVLGEGLFELLHRRTGLAPAFGTAWWDRVIDTRAQLLESIDRRLLTGRDHPDSGGPELVPPMRASVAAARDRLSRIGPPLLVDYVAGWRDGLDVWHRRLGLLPHVGTAEAALAWLGLSWMSTRD